MKKGSVMVFRTREDHSNCRVYYRRLGYEQGYIKVENDDGSWEWYSTTPAGEPSIPMDPQLMREIRKFDNPVSGSIWIDVAYVSYSESMKRYRGNDGQLVEDIADAMNFRSDDYGLGMSALPGWRLIPIVYPQQCFPYVTEMERDEYLCEGRKAVLDSIDQHVSGCVHAKVPGCTDADLPELFRVLDEILIKSAERVGIHLI